MGAKKFFPIVLLILFSSVCLNAANIESTDDLDLEAINFAFDSVAAVEDLKQLQRIADFVKSDPGLMVEISGHTDSTGTHGYNAALSVKRAQSVKKLLADEGIDPSRIQIKGFAFDKPTASNDNIDGRLLNRRAVFSIFKIENGRRDYYYKNNKLVKPLEKTTTVSEAEQAPAESKTDAQKPKTVHPDRDEKIDTAVDDIKERLDQLEKLIREQGKKPDSNRKVTVSPSAASVSFVSSRKYNLSAGIGFNEDNFDASVEGSVFLPTANERFAFQGGFNGSFADNVQELQLDAGLVTRFRSFQFGFFGSTKFIKIDDYNETGNLSQVNIAASKRFSRGSIGIFATEGIKCEDVILTEQYYDYADLVTVETYLDISDKYGVNFDYTFENELKVAGSAGGIDAEEADFFARLRLEYPLFDFKGLGVFLQADYNNGYLEEDENFGALAGLTFYGGSGTGNMDDRIQPMTVQEITYEVKTRTSVLESQVNQAPDVAIEASEVKGYYPLTVTFTAVATDPDGTIASVEWDFGDGETATGETVAHTFSESGNYNVILYVTDNDGASSVASIGVESLNHAPSAYISATTPDVFAPETYTFEAVASDLDGTIVSYEWDFGNGNTGEGQSVSQTYTETGSYIITLTVTDDQGEQTSALKEIYVQEFPF